MSELIEKPSETPVAYRCKDFADGWILYHDAHEASQYQEQTGCLMQPLYVGPEINESSYPPEPEEVCRNASKSVVNDLNGRLYKLVSESGMMGLHDTIRNATDRINNLTSSYLDACTDNDRLREASAWQPPQACDGKEQLAFEAWAVSQRYDMHEHPLHYIFMDPKTNAARLGWNAALRYVREQFSAIRALIPSEPLNADGWAFAHGDYVCKKSGSWWAGRVVGTYATEQTPRGYAVQLDKPFGPVQIYPESALERFIPSDPHDAEGRE